MEDFLLLNNLVKHGINLKELLRVSRSFAFINKTI